MSSETIAESFKSDPEWFLEDTCQENDIVGIIFYRGSWCKYCSQQFTYVVQTKVRSYDIYFYFAGLTCPKYLSDFQALSASSELKIALFAICSEEQHVADETKQAWNLSDDAYQAVVGDDEGRIVSYVKKKYLPELYITDTINNEKGHLNTTNYPKGMAVQPGLVFFCGKSSNVDNMAFAWAVQPSPANLHGSIGRPVPQQVWKKVLECVELYRKGKSFDCGRVGTDVKASHNYVGMMVQRLLQILHCGK